MTGYSGRCIQKWKWRYDVASGDTSWIQYSVYDYGRIRRTNNQLTGRLFLFQAKAHLLLKQRIEINRNL
eukprot:7170653-Prorocentrum_lima.AAC.1